MQVCDACSDKIIAAPMRHDFAEISAVGSLLKWLVESTVVDMSLFRGYDSAKRSPGRCSLRQLRLCAR